MKEAATVVALDVESVWVETQRQGTCGACSARSGCGQGLMNQMMPGREHFIRALIEPQYRGRVAIGDRVSISISDDVVLSASVIVYLVPLGFMIAGFLGGNALFSGDAGALGGGFLGLLLGALAVRMHALRVRDDPRIQPRVTAIDERRLAEPPAAELEQNILVR